MGAETAGALPQTCCPTVWLWPGQAVYAGPSLNLEPHSGSVWCFAVGIDGPLTVTTPDGLSCEGGSLLIPPRLTHQLKVLGRGLVSCYLEPTSVRAEACRSRMSQWRGEIGVAHVAESQLAFTPTDDQSACGWLDLAAAAAQRVIDPRIAAAAHRIREDPATAVPSHELATDSGLSESRFLHLFRDELGTSLRRYRIWVRLVHAGTAIGAGANLTEAAMKSGFASPSHLADRFKSTFGLSASQLLATGLVVRTP
jgi:AraC-like DNA-binding protein